MGEKLNTLENMEDSTMRDLMEYASFCMEMLDEIAVPYSPVEKFTVNTRASRWGLCSLRGGKYYIQINVTLLDDRNGEDGLINTLLHELLHTCPGCMNHGPNWKFYAEKVRRNYGYDIKRTSDNEEKEVTTGNLNFKRREYKYFLYCEKCGKLIARRKRLCDLTEYPYLWKHGSGCGGKLVCHDFEVANMYTAAADY